VLIADHQVKGELTVSAFRHWQEFRKTGSLTADVVDIPN
jgi:hypothetical protein